MHYLKETSDEALKRALFFNGRLLRYQFMVLQMQFTLQISARRQVRVPQKPAPIPKVTSSLGDMFLIAPFLAVALIRNKKAEIMTKIKTVNKTP